MRRATAGALVGGLVVLALGVFVAAQLLERWAERRKQRVLAELAAQLGRPVTAGRVDLLFLGGIGVELPDLTIGPAAGEPRAALQVARVRVRVAVLKTLASAGGRPSLREVLVERPVATLVRHADGSTNWGRIVRRMERRARPADPEAQARARAVRVGRARLVDGRVDVLDLARRVEIAAIRDLDASADDAGLGGGFEARVRAAILDEPQPLAIDARFGRRPQGAPPLEHLALRMAPTDLAPIGPLLAALGGPEAGTVSADLVLEGGEVLASRGTLRLEGARFPGGQPFDGRLVSDARIAPGAGDVTVSRFAVELGGMALEARGRLRDLRGTPRFEGFVLGTHGVDLGRLQRYLPALAPAGATLDGPLVLQARADAGRFALRLDLSAASLVVPGRVRKPAGTALSLVAEGGTEGARITCERLTLAFGPARVVGRGTLERRAFRAELEAEPVAVRPLAALAAPGRAEVLPDLTVSGRLRARGTLGRPETVRLESSRFRIAAGSSDLAGSFALEDLRRPRLSLEARSRYLDLSDFLPERRAERRAELPAVLRRAEGRAELVVSRGRASGVEYRDLRADLTLARGRLRARTLEVAVFGGRFSGSGTELPLDGHGPFAARGRLVGIDLAALLGRTGGGEALLAGRLHAAIDLSAAGTRPEDLQRSLTGTLGGRVEEAVLLPGGLIGPLARSLGRAADLPGLGTLLRRAEERVPAARDRRLGTLEGSLRISDGAVALVRPLRAETPQGPLTVDGRVTLEGRADLTGTWALAPEAVGALTGGRVTLPEPLPVQVRITGPLSRPEVAAVDPGPVLRRLAAGLAGEAPRHLRELFGR